jgi:hypothetical protein
MLDTVPAYLRHIPTYHHHTPFLATQKKGLEKSEKYSYHLISDGDGGQIHNFSKLDWRRAGAEHRDVMREYAERGAGQVVLPRARVLNGQLQVTPQHKTHQVLRLSAHNIQLNTGDTNIEDLPVSYLSLQLILYVGNPHVRLILYSYFLIPSQVKALTGAFLVEMGNFQTKLWCFNRCCGSGSGWIHTIMRDPDPADPDNFNSKHIYF